MGMTLAEKVLAVLVGLTALIAACSGGDDLSAGEPSPDSTLESPPEELMRRASHFDEAIFSATYEMYAEIDATVIEGMFTWYQKDGQVRGDFSGEVAGAAVDVIVIPGPDYPSESFHYVCDVSVETCVESRPESEERLYPDGQYPVVLGGGLLVAEEFGEAFAVEATAAEDILGQQTTCFVAPTAVNQSFHAGEACVTEEGIVLRITQEFDTGDATTMQAAELSRDVDDEVFELPYSLAASR